MHHKEKILMVNKQNPKTFIIYFTYILFITLIIIVIDFIQIQSSKIIRESYQALIHEPPLLTRWIYRDNFYILIGYFFILFLVWIYLFIIPPFFWLFRNFSDQLLLCILSVFLILNLKINKSLYLVQKKFTIIFIAMILFFLFLKYKIQFKKAIKTILLHKNLEVYLIPFISLIQLGIAVYLDPLNLPEGDDPFYYYQTALDILKNKDFNSFPLSPGMTYFIAFSFSIFGNSIYYPKILLGIINALGLFFLLKFISKFFKSRLVTLVAGLFYLSNSHFVSFSIMFWNENLFHPLLSIFLYLFQLYSFTKKNLLLKFFLFFTLILISILMVFTRSWFPWFFIIFCLAWIVNLKFKKISILPTLLLLIIFPIFYLLSINYFNKTNSIFLTSNFNNNFVIGNHPYSQGTYSRHWVNYSQEVGLNINSKEIFYKVIDDNIKNPYITIKNLTKKSILWFFGTGGPRPHSLYYQNPLSIPQAFYRITASLLLFFGVYFIIKKDGWVIPIAYFSIFIVHLIFFADYRFTLTAMPFQSVLVAFGLIHIIFYLKKYEKKLTLKI